MTKKIKLHKLYTEEEQVFYELRGNADGFIDVSSEHTCALDALNYAIEKLDRIFAEKIRLDVFLREWARKNLIYSYMVHLSNRDYLPVGSTDNWENVREGAPSPNSVCRLDSQEWDILENYRKEYSNGGFYFEFNGNKYPTGGPSYLYNDSSTPWLTKDGLRNYCNLLKEIKGVLTTAA